MKMMMKVLTVKKLIKVQQMIGLDSEFQSGG
jgi:hypothetical protein